MIKSSTDTEARYRSLLQKAVRRADADLVYTASALLASLGSKEKNWYRTHTAIITFEECWPLGSQLIFNRKFHSKVAALVRVTRAMKSREASGLGYLAHALLEGDASVLKGSADDKHIKIIANAIKRPDDFWRWIADQKKPDAQTDALITNALHFKQEGLPRDRAVIQSAAYLAVIGPMPSRQEGQPADQPFPYWVAFDKHTAEGKLVMRDVARDLHIALPQLEVPKPTVKSPPNGGSDITNGILRRLDCLSKKHTFSGSPPNRNCLQAWPKTVAVLKMNFTAGK